ncbi:MAG: GNAT family N-acetyltransferase [Clostridiales bacterium]|nr:GNAT family N-acetyltransferase [Clostridiales bacterium]
MIHYCYILECADKTLYTGYTTDPGRRLREHNEDDKRGASYTRTRRPCRLLYVREFHSKNNAMKYEWHIKHDLTREEKLRLIAGEDVFEKKYPVEIKPVDSSDPKRIRKLSRFASGIVKRHYDPIIGSEQNDYMIKLFQSPEAISGQIEEGYNYYEVYKKGKLIGFFSYKLRNGELYLSKYYVTEKERGNGTGRKVIDFLTKEAVLNKAKKISLNVNRNNPTVKIYESLGFKAVREEKNPIGNGFVMDDYVYELSV